MLLAAFLKHFASLPQERYRTLGASSAGRCARALAYAQFPEFYPAEPMTPRRRARLMAGREFERIVMATIQKELPAAAAGETAFLWPVTVDAATLALARGKVETGHLVGHILPDMNPNDVPRWRQACYAKGMTRLGGVVVDPVNASVYIPALSDGIADLSAMPEFAAQPYALATWEFKTMATAGFRKVLGGALDYGYRTQFAIEADAAQLDTHVGMFYRLETSHGIEIVYSRRATTLRATFTLTNGNTFVVEDGIAEPATEWDEVRVEMPFDERLLDQARDRLRRVLAATADNLPAREYGPDFTCPECDGHGEVKCALCDEAGIAKRSKVKKDGTPKEGKPCTRSRGHPMQICEDCDAGLVSEAALGFPCSWCPFLASCYPMARVEVPKKSFARPRVVIGRHEYDAAGLTFTSPGGA